MWRCSFRKRDRATHRAVVFIHGTGAWSETWRASMDAVVKAGFRAIALDLPPFGFSERSSGGAFMTRRAGTPYYRVLDALQIQRAILVGHSFGGGATMEATFLAGDRVRALVLVDVALASMPATRGTVVGDATIPGRAVAAQARGRELSHPIRCSPRQLLELFIADPAQATPRA